MSRKRILEIHKSMLHEKYFVNGIKRVISECKKSTEFSSAQIKWDMLKYRLAEFSRKYSKIRIQKINSRKLELEKIVKEYVIVGNTAGLSKAEFYESAKSELEQIQDNFCRGAMLRSKAEYIDKGEKPTKFFLNLEKSRSAANTISKLNVQLPDGAAEIKSQDKILAHIKHFYSNIFSRDQSKSQNNFKSYLGKVNLPKLSSDNQKLLELPLKIDEMTKALKSMENSKSPGQTVSQLSFMNFFGSI